MMFVKNRSPLHGRTVQGLAGGAAAYLRIDRIGADFVAHDGSVTRCPVFHSKGNIGPGPIQFREGVIHNVVPMLDCGLDCGEDDVL